MNERIVKLFMESVDSNYIPLPVEDHIPSWTAKFAELIVQECCDWIDGSPTSESGCQLLLTKSFIIANLKGHFGV